MTSSFDKSRLFLVAVYSVEFVLTGVLRQEVDYVSYKIEPKPQQNGHK